MIGHAARQARCSMASLHISPTTNKGYRMVIRSIAACVMAAALVLSVASCSPVKPPAAPAARQEASQIGATSSAVPFDATAPPSDGHVGPVDRGFEVQHRRFDSRPGRAAMDPSAKEGDDLHEHDDLGGRDQGAAAIVERSDLFRSPRPGP